MQKYFLLACALLTAMVSSAQTNYIGKIYEYVPAPGQFINTLPNVLADETEADIIRRCDSLLAHNAQGMVCLGAWGGYITFGFEHPVANLQGERDFAILGNAFLTSTISNNFRHNETGTFASQTLQTGSAEPGIIWVSQDANGNGLPDDPWYEIAGSETDFTTRHYSITYHRPNAATDNVVGIDCYGDSIIIKRNTFHQQPYYPTWITSSSYTLYGSLLQPTADSNANLFTLDFGYADNHPNTDANGRIPQGASINIDWAITDDGLPIHLPSINFVRVQTGVCQDAQLKGESSTEIIGATDLHPQLTDLTNPSFSGSSQSTNQSSFKTFENGQIYILRNGIRYTILGNLCNK